MSKRPAGYRRKVIEITPTLTALWAGDYGEAHRFATRASTWFRNGASNEDDLLTFLDAHYREWVTNFHVIIATANQGWFYKLGDVTRSISPFAGDYAVPGPGSHLFRNVVDQMPPRTGNALAPDMDGLRIASDLMAKEIVTGEPIHAQFGGLYEVLYQCPSGFMRVDDVMHFFVSANVLQTGIDILHHPHPTRQWYEDDQLCVASLSTPDAHQQGVRTMTFGIPSVLEKKQIPVTRTFESLATRPNYMCVHHIFEIDGRRVPIVLTMRGDAIDQMFSMSWSGEEIVIEYTGAYRRLMLDQAALIRGGLVPHGP
jgi:hypothetical protein